MYSLIINIKLNFNKHLNFTSSYISSRIIHSLKLNILLGFFTIWRVKDGFLVTKTSVIAKLVEQKHFYRLPTSLSNIIKLTN